MVASDRQVAIYNHWETTNDNLLIEAVAGSGKTTTLIEILKQCEFRTLFVAFNKSIQTEIQGIIDDEGLEQGKAMTMHALGLKAIRGATKFRINNNKKYDITKKIQAEYQDFYNKFAWEDKIKLSYTLMDLIDTTKLFLTDDLSEVLSHMIDMDKNFYDQIITSEEGNEVSFIKFIWTRVLEIRDAYYQQSVIEIDFNDMIYLPVKEQLYIPVRPYYLMIDEAQDLNLCQHALIKLLMGQGDIQKFIAVGDRRQCQPKGTKILMKDLSEKNIEDIVIGDKVISYDIRKCGFVGTGKSWNSKTMKVLDVNISNRLDKLFTFTLDSGHASSYSLSHKCYVQLSEEKMKGKYVVYMMRRGENYRLGISPCFSKLKANAFAPVQRARAEKANDLWILDVFNTRNEAYLQEQILSYQFKIPQTRFIDKSSSDSGLSQKELDIFWSKFTKQFKYASALLEKFDREINYPLWSNTNSSQGGVGNSWKLSSKSMFKTQSCNILIDIMDMCIFDKTNVDDHYRIRKTIVGIYGCTIYPRYIDYVSLDIENNHNYVADGILTSNSIYGFSGAYAESFELFKEYEDTVEFPLDICYRCPGLILQEANNVYDVMQGNKTYDGIVGVVDDIEEIKDESMVICRNSAPLFAVYFELLGFERKVVIKGEDILGNIINFMKPLQYKTVTQARIKIERTLAKLAGQLTTEKAKFKYYKLKENLGIFNILVNYMCLESTKVGDLIVEIQKIFKNDDEKAIILCTIHKSKGLQADVVYILNENLIPSKFARSEKQLQQEVNLKYVARTRAKEEMYYLNLDV